MEKTVVGFIKQRVEEDSDTSFFNIDWDKFDEIIEQAKEIEVKQRGYSEEQVREMLFMALYEPQGECCTTHAKDSIVRKVLKTFK